MQDTAIAEREPQLRGRMIRKGDPDYDAARALYNGMIDKRPLMIARCADVADVVAAVTFARESGLRVAVRGGGHNGPGLGSVDDGLVIDLVGMNGVRVDPASRTVRVGPGCTSGDVDHATHPYGLAVPRHRLEHRRRRPHPRRRHRLSQPQARLTIDNLLEADVVLADGSIVTASKSENADLFWGLRGGGGNFGIVASFLFQAHPVTTVYAGPIFWDAARAGGHAGVPRLPAEGARGARLLRRPEDRAARRPLPAEHQGKRACAVISCYNGPAEEGAAIMAELTDGLPPPLFNWMGEMPFPAMQALFDPFMPKGMQWYWRGDFVKELTDAAIDAHIEGAREMPNAFSLVHLYPIDGAVHRVGPGDAAWNTRDATWAMVVAGIDPDPGKADDITRWTRAYWETDAPGSTGGAYVNFMMDDEDDGRLKATFGDNYARLVALKDKYDPGNFFRVNQNIRPSGRPPDRLREPAPRRVASRTRECAQRGSPIASRGAKAREKRSHYPTRSSAMKPMWWPAIRASQRWLRARNGKVVAAAATAPLLF